MSKYRVHTIETVVKYGEYLHITLIEAEDKTEAEKLVLRGEGEEDEEAGGVIEEGDWDRFEDEVHLSNTKITEEVE